MTVGRPRPGKQLLTVMLLHAMPMFVSLWDSRVAPVALHLLLDGFFFQSLTLASFSFVT
jgi:hypothetical protein